MTLQVQQTTTNLNTILCACSLFHHSRRQIGHEIYVPMFSVSHGCCCFYQRGSIASHASASMCYDRDVSLPVRLSYSGIVSKRTKNTVITSSLSKRADTLRLKAFKNNNNNNNNNNDNNNNRFQVPGSKEGQGSQNRPVDSGRSVGPSAIPKEYPSQCWYYICSELSAIPRPTSQVAWPRPRGRFTSLS